MDFSNIVEQVLCSAGDIQNLDFFVSRVTDIITSWYLILRGWRGKHKEVSPFWETYNHA